MTWSVNPTGIETGTLVPMGKVVISYSFILLMIDLPDGGHTGQVGKVKLLTLSSS